MDELQKLGTGFMIGMLLIVVYLLIKNPTTYNQRLHINDAIHAYHNDAIKNHDFRYGIPVFLVDYDDMETYEATLFRLWDWSDKRILPKEKYEIIKPYIKKN